MIDKQGIRLRWELVGSKLDERGQRLFGAAEARAAGWGGRAAVAEITGLALSTIGHGLNELDAPALPTGQVRQKGGGRRPLTETDETLLDDLRRLVEPATLGSPTRPLLWVSKSSFVLRCAASVTPSAPAASSGCCRSWALAGNPTARPMRVPITPTAMRSSSTSTRRCGLRRQPVISVDTKKKELLGNFKNAGSDWRPKGSPQRVNVHDFADKELGKAVPYGIYDVSANEGWVSVGITSDTAEFAVQSIRHWRAAMGCERYPNMRELTIRADCGGSNGVRVRLWKFELQKLADETGLTLHVHHYPPGTSKWNKIEHRLFCHITQNWRARPLLDRMTIVELIAATTTATGLKVARALDTRTYEKGKKVSDAEMKTLAIIGDPFHPEWNYTIRPRSPANQSS